MALAAAARAGPIAAGYPLVVLILLRQPSLGSSVRYAALSVATFPVPIGAYLIWRYVEFGRLLPNTAVAKRQQFPEVENFLRIGDLLSYAGAPIVLLLAVALGVVLARPLWWRRGLVAFLVPLGLAAVAYAVLQLDWMGQLRFATPVWPLAAFAGVLAVTELLRRGAPRTRAWLVAGLVLARIPSVTGFSSATDKFRAAPTVPMCYVAERYGAVFNAYADLLDVRGGSLLLPDVGGPALNSGLRLVDLVGLVDRDIADFYHRRDMAGLREHVFEQVKPTFIHSHGSWSEITGVLSDQRLARDYYEIWVHPKLGPSSADWVRKDAVPDRRTLAALRAYAKPTIRQIDRERAPRRHCWPVLRPGQTQVEHE